jgi:hypothetical protein
MPEKIGIMRGAVNKRKEKGVISFSFPEKPCIGNSDDGGKPYNKKAALRSGERRI